MDLDPTAIRRALAAFDALPRTQIRAALVGGGIGQSRTPRMHMAEGRRLGLDYSYSLLDFDALRLPPDTVGTVVALAADHGFAGLNVTHPFKQTVVAHLDRLSPEADAIGAVNTVLFRGGKAIGHNTDCWGFAESFRREMHDVRLDCVLLLGAGGAGKAAAHALAALGVQRLKIFDLDTATAERLAQELVTQFPEIQAQAVAEPPQATSDVAGLVNATPVGMAKYPGFPIAAEMLTPDRWVVDVIYFPAETALLRMASARGCKVMSGRGMAIFQAVKAFELITGSAADADAMSQHFDG